MGAALVASLAGCDQSAKQKQAALDARQDCIDNTTDRLEATAIEAAYRDGRLGSAARVRHEIRGLGPQPGFPVTSFVRPDGTLIPWGRMSDDQQRTFNVWFRYTPAVSRVEGPEQEMDALDRARDQCSTGRS